MHNSQHMLTFPHLHHFLSLGHVPIAFLATSLLQYKDGNHSVVSFVAVVVGLSGKLHEGYGVKQQS